MGYPVRYHCPTCETVVEIEREGYLSDQSVTPFPLEGWRYVSPDDDYEDSDVDGIRFVCGVDEGVTWDGSGCGEPFYLSFVRFVEGEPISAPRESEFVELNTGPSRPRWPRGP